VTPAPIRPFPSGVDERDACGTGFVADAGGRPSRQIAEAALEALCRVRHRGAAAADARTGDGAGLLIPIPRSFLAHELETRSRLPALDPSSLGVAMMFVFDNSPAHELRRIVAAACAAEHVDVMAWRGVPTDPRALGDRALETMPRIIQAVLLRPASRTDHEVERVAHRARRRAEALARSHGRAIYFASFSFLTVTYKALVAADQLARFYLDLQEPAVEAAFAIYHQRYSTNTTPTWERAQPFRMLCHNGEINTLAGNVNRMRSREGRLGKWSLLDEEVLRPVIDERGSDSAMLDNVVELLTREGQFPDESRDVRHAMAMVVPAAWEGAVTIPADVRAFYRFHASIMEPWDGPAALVFTDGIGVGVLLDRNGLRPMRYAVSEDGFVTCGSEAGAVDVHGHGLVRRGKLGPGQMLWVNPRDGGVQYDPVERVARHRPYAAWLSEERLEQQAGEPSALIPDDHLRLQVAHGYTREELSLVIGPAVSGGKEPTFSMGDDTPIPPLSGHRRPLYAFFKQRFAQVTNPAIDHLREAHVMSLTTLLGPRDPLLWDRPETAALLEYESFFLFRLPGGSHLDATWPVDQGPGGLRFAVEHLAETAVKAAQQGSGIQVISDEHTGAERAPIPSLMAVGAVNTALLRAGHRTRTSLVVQTDDARESHHFACLLGYGAEAVYPRLGLATVASLALSGRIRCGDSVELALLQYRSAIEDGVLKILSKLGISSVDSYRGAQSFDALGLGQDIIDVCFAGTPSPLGGLSFEDIAEDVLARQREAFARPSPVQANPGLVKFHRGGEYHANNPDTIRSLHRTVDPNLKRLRSTAAGSDQERADAGGAAGAAADDGGGAEERHAAHLLRRAAQSGDFGLYRRFADLVDSRLPSSPRDLLELVPLGPPAPLEDVEPAGTILARFSTGAISHGAISKEAHETLAVAMNMIGGKSNTGEGGEDPERYRTDRNSKIKQVASGRFGVTPEYCAFAEELQIKIAQGSKPGEGGQLPGHKVTPEIARLRHTRPGVALISPAPHHDIYSIEDLAQLVFDLKQVNPAAEVSVKLVSEVGVGTVATGVAKGLAEVIHIAGADGGTGASPLSSIKNAGLPWEIGLAEAQQALAANGLRGRVKVRVDGGLKTGKDVVIAAAFGADEYSFGSAALIAEGCIMLRTCHLDTCPVGIATQRPELREKFAGTPEMVAAYLRAVAEDVRRHLAALGLRSLEEAIGRTELLRQRSIEGRAGKIVVGPLLRKVDGERRFVGHLPLQRQRSELGDRLFREAWPAILEGREVRLSYPITTSDRTVGARLGGEIGRHFGEEAPPGHAQVAFRGSAGLSFGAFLTQGVELLLLGEANDYVGKGMGGGRIVIVPPEDDAGHPCLVGNTVLYGATGGELYVAGWAGERFAVRNSGATAIVEGAGQNACEYMTGGTVVILGPVGQNMSAGMTGGRAFVHDPSAGLPARVNPELVQVGRPGPNELEEVRALIERHAERSGSARARSLLDDWESASGAFWQVVPRADVVTRSQKLEGTLSKGSG
jgi:glutamate synthase (ferredoxin)